MSVDTWRRVKEEDLRTLEALEQGRAIEHDALVGKLFEMAMGGNVVAGLFLLKARHGYREGHTVEYQHNVRLTVELPTALSPDKYEMVVNQSPALLPNESDTDE